MRIPISLFCTNGELFSCLRKKKLMFKDERRLDLGWWTHDTIFRWCVTELHTWNLYTFINQCHPNTFKEYWNKTTTTTKQRLAELSGIITWELAVICWMLQPTDIFKPTWRIVMYNLGDFLAFLYSCSRSMWLPSLRVSVHQTLVAKLSFCCYTWKLTCHVLPLQNHLSTLSFALEFGE